MKMKLNAHLVSRHIVSIMALYTRKVFALLSHDVVDVKSNNDLSQYCYLR